MNPSLQRLAAAHGIALEYHDIWGTLHRVEAPVLRALLAAMHVAAEDDHAVEASLRDAEAARWRLPLEPLTVLRSHARPWSLCVRVATATATAPLAWRVVDESGDVAHHAVDGTRIVAGARGGDDGACVELTIPLDADLAPGYHRIALLADDDAVAEGTLAVAPPGCYRPPALRDGGRAWGVAVQLYALRSRDNWGAGDFGDLAQAMAQWGKAGADLIGVNPLHALFPHDPARASPYSPSSRLFLNPLYLDVEALPEFAASAQARALVASEDFRAELAALRAPPLVDYPGVAAAKHRVLRLVYADARRARSARARQRWAQFEAFKAAGGEPLRRHARFEALQEHFHRARAEVWGWPAWPQAFHDPAGEAVQRFADEHAERVDYFAWLQWQAGLQRAAAAERGRRAGMTVGLYTDLAVSVDRGGAEAWAQQDLYAGAASVGAPPDAFAVDGQDWGLPPMVPARLVAAGYAPFVATLRATMRDAGALRIDHAMGLRRLFWVPPGGRPAQGTYVHYPFDALLGLLALESHRHRCAVIGEDLGTVPDEVREALAANDVLSYRVLLFERDAAGDFRPPQAYPEQALATFSTHDLPTLRGWWQGDDLRLRAAHGMLGPHVAVDEALHGRADERRRLAAALDAAGVLPPDAPRDPAQPASATAVGLAAQRFLARSPCALVVVQWDDVCGAADQANLPGTTDAYPNWRRKLPLAVESLPQDPHVVALAAALRDERPRRALPAPPPAPRASPAPRKAARRNVPLPLAAIPRSTYRLQLHRDFGFADATRLVPYFAALGISHLYCSPYLRARPGSRHGYDVVDHRAFNPEIGTDEDFARFVDALAHHGMSHVCDVVPNHMAIMGEDNAWWMEVLEHGPAAEHAEFFDIDWTPPDATMRGKVLLPVLGGPYGEVLERGELRLVFEPDTGAIVVRYFDHRLPVDPALHPVVLDAAAERAPRTGDELRAIADALRALPSRDATPERCRERRASAAALAARLAQAAADAPEVRAAIDAAVAALNGTPGVPASFDALHELLEAQAWRLASWRVAGDEINYRRFFDINELAGLRMERDDVFDAAHDFLLGLAADGRIGGLRIDHPDGLADPARYVARLQERYRHHVAQRAAPASGPAGLFVVLEKICAQHETLPGDWRVHGDTGYPFANAVNAVLVDPTARARVERAWRAFVGPDAVDFEQAAYEGKRMVLGGALAAGLTTLAGRALAIARADRRTRDFTFSILRRALEETIACFPVYRTYVGPHGAAPRDRRYVDWAVSRARRRSRIADASVFDFVRTLLLAQIPAGAPDAAARLAFATSFQQLTPPVAAKGIEDTAFYRHTRLVSLNDVGSEPGTFGSTRRAFHRTVRERFCAWPSTLLCTSTHDNKRSEDVRARIDVISERPAQWRLAVRRWSRLNRSRKREVDGAAAPSANDEYLLYQTLVGSFPEAAGVTALDGYAERIADYMVKAAREAKLRTSWVDADAGYEEALRAFVSALLAPRPDNRFLDDLRREVRPYAWFGRLNSLSMALLKFTVPGIPDIYQGNELLDFSLVDPDNRRSVDFAARAAALARLQRLDRGEAPLAGAVRALFDGPEASDPKLWLTVRSLAFRNRHPALVAEGDYLPLAASGGRARHVLAFARRHAGEAMIVVACRLMASLGLDAGALPLGDRAWGEDTLDAGFLPDGTVLANAITGESVAVAAGRLPLAAVLASFPGALLYAKTGG